MIPLLPLSIINKSNGVLKRSESSESKPVLQNEVISQASNSGSKSSLSKAYALSGLIHFQASQALAKKESTKPIEANYASGVSSIPAAQSSDPAYNIHSSVTSATGRRSNITEIKAPPLPTQEFEVGFPVYAENHNASPELAYVGTVQKSVPISNHPVKVLTRDEPVLASDGVPISPHPVRVLTAEQPQVAEDGVPISSTPVRVLTASVEEGSGCDSTQQGHCESDIQAIFEKIDALKQEGIITEEKANSLREWLSAHPEQKDQVLQALADLASHH